MWKLLKAYIGVAIMYKYFNPNPCGKNVSDCTVRAICKATGKDWGEVYLRLCMRGYLDGDLPNANACWGGYIVRHNVLYGDTEIFGNSGKANI